MAIIVTNPSTVQFSGAPTEPQDPAVMPLDVGFTEELANAMQPNALASEDALKVQNLLKQQAENPQADLQILPPDVLLNAVGEANFAYVAQTNAAPEVPLLVDGELEVAQASDVLSEQQAAELAAASLAAQMAGLVVQTQAAPQGQVAAPVEVASSNFSVDGASAQPSLAQPVLLEPSTAALPVVGAQNLMGAEAGLSTQAAVTQQVQTQVQQDTSALVTNIQNQATQGMGVDPNSLRVPQNNAETSGNSNSEVALSKIQNAAETLASPVGQANQDVNEGVQAIGNDKLVIKEAFFDLPPDVNSQTTIVKIDTNNAPSNLSEEAVVLVGEKSISIPALNLSETTLPNAPVQSALGLAQTVERGANQILAANPSTLNATVAKTERVSNSQSLEIDSKVTDGDIPAIDAAPQVDAAASKLMDESALKFDAKLGSQAQKDDSVSNNSADLEIISQANLTIQQNLLSSEQSEPIAKGFEEISSTFVSSLVGGPQRPITTVMDWVSLKSQEPPRPVMPHELRLDAGAVQVEIQRMVKQGGGHVVMELTPPDQSKFTIELKLDDNGGAYLRVEGVSDSTKTRLEQSAPQLQEQFQQMGLNLQLDMRQNRDSSSSTAAEWMANESGSNDLQTQESSPQAARAVAAERARKNNGGQVYLYA